MECKTPLTEGDNSMKKRILIFTILFTLILATGSWADVYLKQKVTQSGAPMMGQTDPQVGTQIQEVWMSPAAIRTNMDPQSVILDLKNDVIRMLNTADKTYSEMPMDLTRAMAGQMSSDSTGDQAGFEQMMQGMMKMELTVEPTAEKKKIGQWDCQKYIQTLKMAMGTITTEIWATEDVKINPELYHKFATAMMARQPGMAGSLDAMMQEQKKIKGIPVFQKTSGQMMGMQFETTTELIEAKEITAPESLFTVPADYQKRPLMGNE